MRRAAVRRSDARPERGAAAMIVALSMVVLVGFVALAVDTGVIQANRVRLQNGADAGALAIARDCADHGTTSCAASAPTTAQDFADSNSISGTAEAPAPTFPATGTVRVETAAKDSTGTGLALAFGGITGVTRADVRAEAVAQWGGPSGGPVALPVTMSECQFDLTGAIQLLQMHGDKTCVSSSPSGQVIPGGFEWLDSDPGLCGLRVTMADPVASKPGNSEPSQCKQVFDSLKNQVVVLPVFDSVDARGYHIKGFAAFELLGFSFSGHRWNNTGRIGCTGSCRGLIGRFVEFTTLEDFSLGGPDLGARVVKLTQ